MGNSEVRDAQVIEQLAVLNTTVEDAFAVLRTLHSRLEGVLLPESPTGLVEGSEKVGIPLVAVASEIKDIRYKVSNMLGLTQSIVSRLEL